MVNKNLKVTNSQGFHMRPATVFVNAMAKYQSTVTIKFNGLTVNGKSLMNLIAACIKFGSEIEVVCEGEDEEAALNEAVSMDGINGIDVAREYCNADEHSLIVFLTTSKEHIWQAASLHDCVRSSLQLPGL